MTLTPAQRAYLRNAETSSLPLYDMVLGFISKFNVTPEQCGALLAVWIREVV